MSAQNAASKYLRMVDERFTADSYTEAAFGLEFDWTGVDTISIYNVKTSSMNDYEMNGSERYGTPTELETGVQTMVLTQDKSFTYTIDRRNYTDQMMVTNAALSLRRQIDEEVVPMVDTYRFGVLAASAGTTVTSPITRDDAYEAFIEGTKTLRNNKAPINTAIAFVSGNFLNNIKLDDNFIKKGDASQRIMINGEVGMIDGVRIVSPPDNLLPDGVEFIITIPAAGAAPKKLEEYKTHVDPPGISGWKIEGRVYHDAFVLNNKRPAIYVHMSA